MNIENARNTIIEAFKKDPDFRQLYADNIACIIMDNAPSYRRNKNKRDELADKILRHILW